MESTKEIRGLIESIGDERFYVAEAGEKRWKIEDEREDNEKFEIPAPSTKAEAMRYLLDRERQNAYDFGKSMGNKSCKTPSKKI